ncbi:MAG: HD domain-containing protein [Candidatus Omnitrophica bacterium]|nr:HD domain-containing protein [Candidatus Omnitrophota bacterium]
MAKDIIISDLFFEKILENIDCLAMVVDGKGYIKFGNPKFLDFSGLGKKESFDKNWIEKIVPEDKRPSAKKAFDSIKGKKKLYKLALPILGVGNLEIYSSWMVMPLGEDKPAMFLFMGEEDRISVSLEVDVQNVAPEDVKASQGEVIRAIFEASRICEPGTARHASRVMYFAEILANKLKIRRERVEKLKIAALLHDLGKLLVDHKVLFKKGKLTKEEFDHIKKHLDWGVEIAKMFYFLEDIIPIIENHHENYDGRGYPGGARGKDIPIEARILSIADVYEALTADRPYRKAFSREEAIAIMEYEKGYKLDPRITNIFLDMVKEGKFKGSSD